MKRKEILWKASHKVLPTKKYLYSWNKDIAGYDKCPFCRQRESIEHALIVRGRLTDLWNYVKEILTRINGKDNQITIPSIIFNGD